MTSSHTCARVLSDPGRFSSTVLTVYCAFPRPFPPFRLTRFRFFPPVHLFLSVRALAREQGGPGKWVYSYVGGIGQTDASLGFEHVVLTPPATLIELAHSTTEAPPKSTISAPLRFASATHKTLRGTIAFEWSVPSQTGASATCDVAHESEAMQLGCAGSTIETVAFAEYGAVSGSCASGKCTLPYDMF